MTMSRYAALCLLLAVAAPAPARTPDDMELPFDRYSWVTTHNAFTSNGLIPNQSQTIDVQLTEGVRGLMLDLHFSQGRVRLCHKVCTGEDSATFADLLNGTILPFLDNDTDAIVSLHLEDTTTIEQLSAELALVPGLAGRTVDPRKWTTPSWPTYRQLRDGGQRLLIFSLNEASTGDFRTGTGVAHILPSIEYTVENYWSLGTTFLQHDDECYSRWSEEGRWLDRSTIEGKPGWRPLFTMNQFHGVPFRPHADTDNSFDSLSNRYTDHCRPIARRKPNFVAVDFHEVGEVAKFVEWLTLSAPDAL
jgi:chitinase